MLNTWKIRSRFVQAEIQSLGAMLAPAWFDVGDRQVQPFAVAPWSEDAGIQHETLPGLLQRLHGEWACVPYGVERDPGELPAAWESAHSDAVYYPNEAHGRSSNAHWTLKELAHDYISLCLEYPSHTA
jgi:hypothetical protein